MKSPGPPGGPSSAGEPLSATHRNASAHSSCPICHHHDWCWISAEGDVAGCRREPGASNQHVDRSGVPFWMYSQEKDGTWVPGLARGRIHTQPDKTILDDGAIEQPAGVRRTYSHERAAVEDIDGAYRALFGMLKLDIGHEQALMSERGFLKSELERAGYRSRSHPLSEDALKAVRLSIASRLYPRCEERLREQQALHESLAGPEERKFTPDWNSALGRGWSDAIDRELYRVPGFWRDAGDRTRFGSVDGTLVPVHDIADRIIAIQVRASDGTYLPPCAPRDLTGGVSGAPSGQHAHIPTFCPRTSKLTLITEGVLKADRIAAELARAGVPILVIGLPHVGAWRLALPILEQAKVEGVLLAYDADARRKGMVAAGLTNLACAVAERGLGVALLLWPETSGKGLDDVIHASKLATVESLAGEALWTRLGELQAQCKLPVSSAVDARRTLSGLVDRIRSDHAKAYTPEVIAALAALPEVSVEYQRLTDTLSAKGVLGRRRTAKLLREAAVARQGGHAKKGATNGADKPAPFQTTLQTFDYGEDKLVAAVAEAHKALARANAYTNGSFLVRVAMTSKEAEAASAWRRSDGVTCYAVRADALQMVTLTPATLRLAIAEQLQFVRTSKAGTFPILPPAEVVKAIHDLQAGWPLLQFRGLSNTPLVRGDGSIAQQPGFDPASGYWIDGALAVPTISETPSENERREAYDFLREPFVDFPWSQRGAECVPIAEILQIMARPYIDGAVPGYVHDASAGGTGKTLQTDCVSLVTQGRYASRKAYPARGDDADDEINKFLGGYALRGTPYIVLDDIKRALGGQTLDMVLTANDCCDFRILGQTRTVTLPWRATLAFTGVNIAYFGQMSRRVLVARIESPLERPQDRADFRHSPLPRWIMTNRAKLVAAALTVLRAYIAAGCPNVGTGVWGSFEAWSALIPGAIKYAGGPNLLDYRVSEEAFDRDRETDVELAAGLEDYLEYIHEPACSAHRIAKDVCEHEPADDLALRSTLIAATRSKSPDARAIGNVLRAHRGRAISMGRGRAVKIVYTLSVNKRDPGLWSIQEIRPATETAEARAEHEKANAWEAERRRLEEMM
jgi:hypothetical protein